VGAQIAQEFLEAKMTPLQVAQARADQALATLRTAEKALAKALRQAGIVVPWYATAAEVATWRVVESRLEHPDTAGSPLAHAHAAFRRAQRMEMRALSAAHRARFEIRPPSGASGAPTAMTADEVLAGLQERRRAA
jgi:hypothetical protein